jgi:hypothetical protein
MVVGQTVGEQAVGGQAVVARLADALGMVEVLGAVVFGLAAVVAMPPEQIMVNDKQLQASLARTSKLTLTIAFGDRASALIHDSGKPIRCGNLRTWFGISMSPRQCFW